MVPQVIDFNRRLRASGVAYQFPETPTPEWLPPATGAALFQEYFLASDGGAVRGGYVLKHQPFALGGALTPVGNYRLPLSEGLCDPTFAPLGARLLRHCLKRQPLLYAAGIGSRDEDIARMLRA